MPTALMSTKTEGAAVTPSGDNAWRLEIPAGPAGSYRLAQLDDYDSLPRKNFPWQPPFHLSLRARASAEALPGTWGLGLWNNPFGFSILTGVEILRLPAMPNTIWFFFASPKNYLSLYDDIPATGPLAASFQAKRFPPWLLALGAPALPLFLFPPAARLLRRLGRRFVHQDAVSLSPLDQREWHAYQLEWQKNSAAFYLDGKLIMETEVSPNGPLGFVIWIDNQYAALPPNGRLAFGTQPNPEPAWIEVENLSYGPF